MIELHLFGQPSLDTNEALDLLSEGFDSSSTAPQVQSQIPPSAPPATVSHVLYILYIYSLLKDVLLNINSSSFPSELRRLWSRAAWGWLDSLKCIQSLFSCFSSHRNRQTGKSLSHTLTIHTQCSYKDIHWPTRASLCCLKMSDGATSAMDALSETLDDIRPAPAPAPVLPKNIVKVKKKTTT